MMGAGQQGHTASARQGRAQGPGKAQARLSRKIRFGTGGGPDLRTCDLQGGSTARAQQPTDRSSVLIGRQAGKGKATRGRRAAGVQEQRQGPGRLANQCLDSVRPAIESLLLSLADALRSDLTQQRQGWDRWAYSFILIVIKEEGELNAVIQS